ncbi:MAG: hypothetical protein NTW04_06310 [Elusimicrobia bacterium]|nr:hypothetical protein [Elusimicrobiota bacterium]
MKKTLKKPIKRGGKSACMIDEVQKLYGFMQKNSLGTLDYKQGDSHVRLVRRQTATVAVPIYSDSANRTQQANKPQQAVHHGLCIKSPLMGIFFRAASPSSPPFFKEGETVKAGQVICLIEAMKVFNEVKAEFDCVITKALVENGKPVKAGQDLFAIEKK